MFRYVFIFIGINCFVQSKALKGCSIFHQIPRLAQRSALLPFSVSAWGQQHRSVNWYGRGSEAGQLWSPPLQQHRLLFCFSQPPAAVPITQSSNLSRCLTSGSVCMSCSSRYWGNWAGWPQAACSQLPSWLPSVLHSCKRGGGRGVGGWGLPSFCLSFNGKLQGIDGLTEWAIRHYNALKTTTLTLLKGYKTPSESSNQEHKCALHDAGLEENPIAIVDAECNKILGVPNGKHSFLLLFSNTLAASWLLDPRQGAGCPL